MLFIVPAGFLGCDPVLVVEGREILYGYSVFETVVKTNQSKTRILKPETDFTIAVN